MQIVRLDGNNFGASQLTCEHSRSDRMKSESAEYVSLIH